MALTDTFVKNIKPGTAAGEKHTDGQGLYLHVKDAGKYWRMNYRFADKQKTLALGVYPAVSLAKARARRDKARELLADGIDPSTAKQEDRQAKADAAANTFEKVARDWLIKTKAKRAEITHLKVSTWLEKDAFPFIGNMPISTIGPRDVLDKVVRKPGSKMKMKVEHVVPLCTQALELLHSVQPLTGHGRYVFPSLRTGERPMSENTINGAVRAMGYSKEVHTAHGFRATARTIMDEVLDERVDLIEHQLAHTVKDANGRAYNRTAHLPARREMMQRWADYLDRLAAGAEVIQFKAA